MTKATRDALAHAYALLIREGWDAADDDRQEIGRDPVVASAEEGAVSTPVGAPDPTSTADLRRARDRASARVNG